MALAAHGAPLHAADSSSDLLFSTQFFINTVEARLGPECQLQTSEVIVGFQLLQFEIPTLLQLQHGKSCLFQADPDRLALDLERESDAPLALLVMRRDHGRARLVAFASIPMDLHTVGRILSNDMRFRVCEWASNSGSWELHDHMNRVIGRATGAVTLSCLGRTLAPHITRAIGLH
ncbi:hypothetical protein PybrP1_004099 [[Pythium] brassicae (nom. inval.)]|nr:hypothetical protein PybrP1_004099 [[Pythium] brassicae (nom. inval.)]